MSLATGYVFWALVAAAPVEVHSTKDCPSSDAISERLRPLLPAASERDAADSAEIEPAADPAKLELRLRRADGYVIGERQLPMQNDCAATAEAIAAIIAAWKSAPSTREPGTEPPPHATVVVVPLVPVAPPPPRFDLTVGAGAGAALIGGIAGTGNLEVLAGLRASRWQLRLAGGTQTTRQLDMGGGHVDWGHTSFAAGVVLRSLHPRWRLSAEAGPVLGWATLVGEGFSPNRTQRSFEWGGTAGLRCARWLGRFALWIEARASAWGNGQQPRATNATGTATATRDLPMADASVSLGFSSLLVY